MSKFFLILVCLIIFTRLVSAQDKIIIQGKSPKLYIWHTVVSKENVYSISLAYHSSSKVVAKQNQLNEKSILKRGKKIKIPLNNNNFTQSIKTINSNVLPVYYVVRKKESLFIVAKKNGNLNIDLLKKWNRLNSIKVNPSQKIIIGFLIKNSETSATIETEKFNQDFNIKSDHGYDTKEKATSDVPITTPKADTAFVNELVTDIENTQAPDDEGFYVDSFPISNSFNQAITLKGEVLSFKSSSGWTDKKYFVLINGVAIGTIVRLTNPSNNRSICAKVIGVLPNIKSNNNLIMRLSSAAAHILKLTESKGSISIVYFK